MFEKMKPIEGGFGGCGNCGYQHEQASLQTIVLVGLGYAGITKNGEEIFRGDIHSEKCRPLSVFEWMARREPDADWRLHLVAPLSERHYQRQDKNQWVLYEKSAGFA